MTTTISAVYDTTGFVQFENVKFNVCVGRSPREDPSTGPKSFFALKSTQAGKNSRFYFEIGLSENQWQFYSLDSVVTKVDNPVVPGEAPRPVALVGDNAIVFKWKTSDTVDAGVFSIEDFETGLVWTLSKGFEEDAPGFVTLEEPCNDESQLWRFKHQPDE